jgi:hypothetical protein
MGSDDWTPGVVRCETELGLSRWVMTSRWIDASIERAELCV